MTKIYRTNYPTKLQAGACWTGPYQTALRDTSCARKKPDWRSRHAAAPHVLPTPRLPTSLRRCVAFLLPTFSASFLPGWRLQWSSARICPLIPRGHLAMCPHPAASLITLSSSTRFRPDAYHYPDPRGSVENRPTGVTSKPANGFGPGRDPFYPAFS